jgi:hypothetical protein
MARIGQILVTLGATTENNVARALGVQGFAGGRLGTLLLERGSITEDALGEALAQQHGRPYVPWTVLGAASAEVIASLPAKFAIRHSAIPFERSESALKIALRDPSDLRILDELFFVTGRKILPSVAPEVRIYHALERYYGEARTPRYTILGDRLSRRTPRQTRSEAPPPPPGFLPSGQQPKPAPQPHEVWGDAAESEVGEAPIIQRWKIPGAPAAPWAIGPVRDEGAAPEPPEEESIIWEEAPPHDMWLPETAAAPVRAAGAMASPEPRALAMPPPEPEALVMEFPAPSPTEQPAPVASAAPPPAPEAPAANVTATAAVLPEIFVPAEPEPPASPEALAPPALAEPPPAASEKQEVETRPAPPSEADFPEVLAAQDRESIAAAALAALSRRFGRGAFFVVRPRDVAGHSATGPGIDRDAFRAISIPWNEPSVFLNVRLSRSFHLGPLPPMARHRSLVEALGALPEECLLQPVVMKDKPVAFLFAEFGREQGATPMDLAYMRGLANATASAFATAIRHKKREPV